MSDVAYDNYPRTFSTNETFVEEYLFTSSPDEHGPKVPEPSATPPSTGTWYRETLDLLLDAAILQPNWDSYDGLPTTDESIDHALRFLNGVMQSDTPVPSVVPLNDGGVQLEWHRGGVDIEAVFSAEDDPDLYLRDIHTGDEHELDIRGIDTGLVNSFIARLAS